MMKYDFLTTHSKCSEKFLDATLPSCNKMEVAAERFYCVWSLNNLSLSFSQEFLAKNLQDVVLSSSNSIIAKVEDKQHFFIFHCLKIPSTFQLEYVIPWSMHSGPEKLLLIFEKHRLRVLLSMIQRLTGDEFFISDSRCFSETPGSYLYKPL